MKKNFFTRMKEGFVRLWAALKSHPVELFILLHATVAASFDGNPWWQHPAPYAAIATMTAFCLSRFRKGRNWALWVYWAVIPLYALTAFLPTEWSMTVELGILNFLLPAVYLLTLVTREGAGFSERFYRLVSSFVSALALASIVFILLMLVNLTLEILFSLTPHISNRLMEVSLCFCYIFLAPMLFISFESQEGQPEVALLVERTINYVLTPILLLYNLILYVYLAVILVNWELPKGSVSSMVLVFTIVAVAIRLVRPLLGRQPLKWYFRWFSLFALPLLVLFWVAVAYRIGQYGITIDRCILIVAGALMTLYLIGSILFNSQSSPFNFLFTALLVLCGVVLTVGGPLSARQISLRSQTAIVREKAEALGILALDGTIDTTAFVRRSEADTAYRKEHRAAYQAMKYIEHDLHDTSAVRTSLGMTASEYLDRLSPVTSKYATAWRVDDRTDSETVGDAIEAPIIYISCRDQENIDITGYSRMSTGGYIEGDIDRYIPYPGGRILADSLLATQLAKIGCTPSSDLTEEFLDRHSKELCLYHSPDGKVLIVLDQLSIRRSKDSLYHITYAGFSCALAR